jgi:quercetin dioxygenase-like cupin family protein
MELRRKQHALPIDRRAVARDWQARGFSCGLFVDPPGRAWPDFMHEADELVTVMEGALELIVAGEAAALQPGDEAFIPRRQRHSVRNIHHGTSRWLYGYGA